MLVRYPNARDRADAAVVIRQLMEMIDAGEVDAPTWYRHRLVGVLVTLDPRPSRHN